MDQMVPGNVERKRAEEDDGPHSNSQMPENWFESPLNPCSPSGDCTLEKRAENRTRLREQSP